MTASPDWRQEQRRVARAMVGALVMAVFVLGIAWMADRSGPAMPFADRLAAALRADVFVVVWLVAAVGNVARLRFFSERDIAGSGAGTASPEVRVANAILQNTMEQVVIAVSVHFAVAATFARSTATITMLVTLFAVGRALFWAGYHSSAGSRAFGFALTFYPSVLVLAVTVVRLAGVGRG